MSEATEEQTRRFERAILELALNQAAVRVDRSGFRSRLGALEDEVEESARDLIEASASGIMSTIVCSASVSSEVSAVYDQITMSLTLGTPTLELMLERDACAATLGAVMLGMHAQVDAAAQTVTYSGDEEAQATVLAALEQICDSMPWCEHTAQAMLSIVDKQAMYARPLDQVAQTLGGTISWPPTTTQEEQR